MEDKVIQGTYADFKVIKTRKVLQMVIEIPIEKADEFTNKFGMPNPSVEKWVAVAHLNTSSIHDANEYTKIIQIAGILCTTAKFGEFLNNKFKTKINVNDSDAIANLLRSFCGIKSRTDLSVNAVARKAFNDLRIEYRKWLET
tara:strand:+ start:104 stop:532 length:429 start_codon:yes stop_codon:yes gene_type:complete